jgi:hypothetical protein
LASSLAGAGVEAPVLQDLRDLWPPPTSAGRAQQEPWASSSGSLRGLWGSRAQVEGTPGKISVKDEDIPGVRTLGQHRWKVLRVLHQAAGCWVYASWPGGASVRSAVTDALAACGPNTNGSRRASFRGTLSAALLRLPCQRAILKSSSAPLIGTSHSAQKAQLSCQAPRANWESSLEALSFPEGNGVTGQLVTGHLCSSLFTSLVVPHPTPLPPFRPSAPRAARWKILGLARRLRTWNRPCCGSHRQV